MNDKDENVKIEIELPRKALEFAEFYGKICGEDRDSMIRKATITKLKELRGKIKQLPYVEPRECKDKWQIV